MVNRRATSAKTCDFFCLKGDDAIHTLELPDSNRTTDQQICGLAEAESRIVITKDSDFIDSYLLKNRPPKLLVVGVGNISNKKLIDLFSIYFDELHNSFNESDFIEITNSGLIIHQKL